MTSFTSRLAEAIRKRTYPNTALHLPQLAGAIGSDGRSLTRWIRGESKPFAEAVDELGKFFGNRGDKSFLQEVYGIEEAAPDFSSLRHELHQVLSRLPAEDAPVASTCIWITDDGLTLPAPVGHADLIRRRTNLSLHVKGDLRASHCRNRGWVALEHTAQGQVTIWHHSAAISPKAISAAQDWLSRHGEDIRSVTREIEVDGTLGTVTHPDAQSAIEALERLLAPSRRITTPLQINRCNLGELPKELGDIVRAFTESPDTVIPTAYDLGLMRRASILTVRGSEVRSEFMGPGIGFCRKEIVGKNVLARTDAIYGTFIHARIKKTHDGDEPTYAYVTGEAYGRPLNYWSLATPAGNGQVLTISRELETA